MSTPAYQESSNIVVQTSITGASSTTFPSTTTAFASGPHDATNNTWVTIGTFTATTTSPTLTFSLASGLSSDRWYVDALQFISLVPVTLQSPQINSNGTFSFTLAGGNAGFSYLIQSSTNLVNWNAVTTINNPSGPVPVLLQPPPGSAYFYRAILSQ
jgi:hypothetical protein